MTSEPQPDVAAAILVGGRSSRMGRDKALLPLGEGTVLGHVVRAAREAVGGPVCLVGRVGETDEYAQFGLPIVADSDRPRCVLAGIESALGWSPHERVLVLACDLPLVPVDVLAELAGAGADSDIAIACGPRGPEPVVAVYARTCLAAVRESLDAGALKAVAFHAGLRVWQLGGERLAALDPGGLTFCNVNDPEEYERIKALASERGSP